MPWDLLASLIAARGTSRENQSWLCTPPSPYNRFFFWITHQPPPLCWQVSKHKPLFSRGYLVILYEVIDCFYAIKIPIWWFHHWHPSAAHLLVCSSTLLKNNCSIVFGLRSILVLICITSLIIRNIAHRFKNPIQPDVLCPVVTWVVDKTLPWYPISWDAPIALSL